MFKKIFYIITVVLVSMSVISCGDTTSSTTTLDTNWTSWSVPSYELPDLTGLNATEAQDAFFYIDVNLTVEEVENNEIADGLFVGYGDSLVAGDLVNSGATITAYFSINYPELPDLAGLSKTEMRNALDELEINYVFKYETNQDLEENTFIGYEGLDEVGATYNNDHEVVVIISTTDLILPDLTGLDQTEIFFTLFDLGINFETEIVTDNTVEDQTFVSYGDGLIAGNKIPASFTITVIVGFNSAKLPDLAGLSKEKIMDLLDDLNIPYSFEYIVNDNYTEYLFDSYRDFVAGDFYDSGVITINLYKNTFTDNEISLFISKYVDGGNDTSDQAIELYNPTTSNIDLTDYHIVIYTNGSLDINYSIDLTGTLAPEETYVIANSSANSTILAAADLTSADLVFDGNDVIQLCYLNGTYIDTIYTIGTSSFVMDEEVFVRDSNIVSGTRNYVANEWFGFVPSYTEILGTHPVTLPDKLEFILIDRDFWDPLGGMDLVTYSGLADGDTAYFTPGFLADNRVRFLGCDTPETYPVVQDWGLEAKEYTRFLLENAQQIYIQSDPDSGFVGGYGRPLGLVWVNLGETGVTYDHLNSNDEVVKTEFLSGWVLVNYQIILNGYSYNYYGSDSTLSFGNRYLFRWFQEAERQAVEDGIGLHE